MKIHFESHGTVNDGTRKGIIISAFVLSFVVSVTTSLLAQDKTEVWMSRIPAVMRDTSRFSITSLGNGIIKILNKGSGTYTLKNISDYGKYSPSATLPSLVIDMTTIDTSVWSSMYSFWQEVPLGNIMNYPPIVSDQNHNGKPEITDEYLQYGGDIYNIPFKTYEAGTSGDNFAPAFTYSNLSGYSSLAAMDSLKNVPSQIFLLTRGGLNAGIENFRSPDSYSLSTQFNYLYSPCGDSAGSQLNTPVFFNMNGSGDLGVIYFNLGWAAADTAKTDTFGSYSYHIAEYDSSINNFELKYYWRPSGSARSSWWGGDGYGFATGTFDMDGKTEFAMGTVFGDVHLLKCFGPDSFAHTWSGTVETYNAWMACGTNDIDHDGKPEFWIGGDAYYNGVPMTVITCFESSGDNQYIPVYRIEVIGIMSFYCESIMAADVDGDGNDELVAFLGGALLIFKNIGSNPPRYKLFYLKTNELANQSVIWTSGTMADLDGDGIPEILISKEETDPSGSGTGRYFTDIYRHNFPTDVVSKPPSLPSSFALRQNYPNPFNPSTVIDYQLPMNSQVVLKVYDILGREVATLVDEKQSAGTHSVRFDGANLSSGVYFYRLTAGSFTDTKKMVLVR